MKTKTLWILSWLLLSTNLFAQDSNFYIYLCFGQSNMEGQGGITRPDRNVDSRFKVFQALDCPNLGRTKATWYTAVPPTCQCYSGLSPADYFGRTMVANLPDSITVGIINVSVGGCDIRLFDKDIYMNYDSTYTESWFLDKIKAYGGNPYQYLIDLAKLAQQDGVIKGILLHQGETNTGDPKWPSYVKKIYNDMLADLSLNANEVPILAGEVLATSGSCCASMNTIIRRLPDTIPTAHVISSEGCPGQDIAHFSSEGYRILGRRYAVKMLSLMGYEANYTEAECGNIGKNWKILSDKSASNGAYLNITATTNDTVTPPSNPDEWVEWNITINNDTTYYLYGRFKKDSIDNNACWIKIDNGNFELFNINANTAWEWHEIKKLRLSAGQHNIILSAAQNEILLDKICIKNSEITPVSAGEEASVICTPNFTPTSIQDKQSTGYKLYQNIPNPVNSQSTIIHFEIPRDEYVSLKIFNGRGQEIAELAGKKYTSGKHAINFSTKNLAPGTYIYTMKAGSFADSRKMILSGKKK